MILVGEMRDQRRWARALSAAETGHFVMSTLHTTDAQETIARIIDFFPPPRAENRSGCPWRGRCAASSASGW